MNEVRPILRSILSSVSRSILVNLEDVPYLLPNTTLTFAEVISGNGVKAPYETLYDFVFGSDAVASPTQIALKANAALPAWFHHHGNNAGPAGDRKINNEVQNYLPTSDTDNYVFTANTLDLTATLENSVIGPKLITRNPASNVTYSRTVPLADTSGLVVGQVIGFGRTVGPANLHTTRSYAISGTVANGDTATMTFSDTNAGFSNVVIALTATGADTPDTLADAFVTAINADATLAANNITAYRPPGVTGAFFVTNPHNSLSVPADFGNNAKGSLKWLGISLAETGAGFTFELRTECFITFVTAINAGVSVTLNHPVTLTKAQPCTFSPVQIVVQKSNSYNSATIPVTETSGLSVGQAAFLGYQDNNLRRITAINPGVSVTLNAKVWVSAGLIWAFYPVFWTTANAGSTGTVLSMAAVPAGVEAGQQFMNYFATTKTIDPIFVVSKTATTVTLDTSVTVSNGDSLYFLPPINSAQLWSKFLLRPGSDGNEVLAFEAQVVPDPQTAFGSWPAFWLYQDPTDPLGNAALADGTKEVDFTDIFNMWNNGTHNNYTAGLTSGGTITTPYSATLTGNNFGLTERLVQGVWTKTGVGFYLDDGVKKLQNTNYQKRYRSQLAINLAVGSIAQTWNSNGFFPIDFSQFPLKLQIKRIHVMRAIANVSTQGFSQTLLSATRPSTVTLTRASTGTDIVSGAGVVSAIDAARISTANGLLVEGQRTNFVAANTASVPAGATGCSITTGFTDVFGGTTAVRLNEGAGSAFKRVEFGPAVSVTSGQRYMWSAVLEAGTRTLVQLHGDFEAAANLYVNYQLTGNGSVTAQHASIIASGIIPLGSNRYRCWAVWQAAMSKAAAQPLAVCLINSTTATRNPSYVGTNTNLFVSHPQLCVNQHFSSVIPTTDFAVTRSADNVSLTSPAKVPHTSGTLLVTFTDPLAFDPAGASPVVLFLANATESVKLALDAATGKVAVSSSGLTAPVALLSAAAPTAGSTVRVALRWGVNDWAMSVNGAAVVKDTAADVFSSALTSVLLGGDGTAGDELNSYIQGLVVYTSAMTDAQLESMSGPFIPTSLPDLAAWYDAADTSSIVQSGGSVSQWNDKSSNSRHATQGTGANQPVTGTRTINGRNVLDFDGSNDSLICPAATANYGATTFIAVHLSDVTTSNLAIYNSDGAGGASTRFFFNSQEFAIGNGARARASLTSGSAIINVGRVNQTGSATQRIIWNNEAELSNAVSRLGVGSNFRLGSGGAGSGSFYNGTLAEIMIYHRELSNAEVNQIANYLATKWGITWTNI